MVLFQVNRLKKWGRKMSGYDKLEIVKSREYTVAKSNQVVQKSRYDFSLNEQKALAFVCSMIKPTTAEERALGMKPQLDYEFEILDFIRILGLEQNGRVYNEVKATLKSLSDKSMWLTLEDGSETVVRWLDRVTTNKRSGKAKVRIDDRLAPYLFDLQEKYMSYGLLNVLAMKSQYSIRLYELLKSYHDMKSAQTDRRSKLEKEHNPKSISWTIELDELKKMLMVDTISSYSDFSLFRKYVIEIAMREINELTDISVLYSPIKKGRKVEKLQFEISQKKSIDKWIANTEASEKLDCKSREMTAEEKEEYNRLTANAEQMKFDI